MTYFDHHRRIAALVDAFRAKHTLKEHRDGAGRLVSVSWEPKE